MSASKYPATATVVLLSQENPKRGKSRERFALYKPEQTVEEALKAGVLSADLTWDVAHGYVAVRAAPQTKRQAPRTQLATLTAQAQANAAPAPVKAASKAKQPSTTPKAPAKPKRAKVQSVQAS
jgi:hypothetical protein